MRKSFDVMYIQLTNKGQKRLIHEGFEYAVDKHAFGKIYWRCVKRCGSRCVTNMSGEEMVKMPGMHIGHIAKPASTLLAEKKFSDLCSVSANVMFKPAQIISKFHGETPSTSSVPSDSQLRSRLAYQRRKKFGSQHSKPQDILKDVVSVDGEKFVLYNGKDYNDMIILGTDQNLRHFFLPNVGWEMVPLALFLLDINSYSRYWDLYINCGFHCCTSSCVIEKLLTTLRCLKSF